MRVNDWKTIKDGKSMPSESIVKTENNPGKMKIWCKLKDEIKWLLQNEGNSFEKSGSFFTYFRQHFT